MDGVNQDGNLTQEQARVPRKVFLPLLKQPIIHSYHIYKLGGTWNGLGRPCAVPMDTCWVLAITGILQKWSNLGNLNQEQAVGIR